MKLIIACLFFIVVLPMAGQVSSYDELTMESDSIKTTYKPSKKNFALVRSKRGTSGLNKTPRADSILALPVTEIILVFSELDASAIADRDEANRERWDNLIMTYPEFFKPTQPTKQFANAITMAMPKHLNKCRAFMFILLAKNLRQPLLRLHQAPLKQQKST